MCVYITKLCLCYRWKKGATEVQLANHYPNKPMKSVNQGDFLVSYVGTFVQLYEEF